MSGTSDENKSCNFCGGSVKDVRWLIAGPGELAICDQCITLSAEIINDKCKAMKLPPLFLRLDDSPTIIICVNKQGEYEFTPSPGGASRVFKRLDQEHSGSAIVQFILAALEKEQQCRTLLAQKFALETQLREKERQLAELDQPDDAAVPQPELNAVVINREEAEAGRRTARGVNLELEQEE